MILKPFYGELKPKYNRIHIFVVVYSSVSILTVFSVVSEHPISVPLVISGAVGAVLMRRRVRLYIVNLSVLMICTLTKSILRGVFGWWNCPNNKNHRFYKI